MTGHPGWVAVAAISLETYDSTQSQVARGLAVGGAVFTVIAGAGAYWLARAALSPVERLRRQAAAISVRDGDPAVLHVPRTRDEIAALAETMDNLLSRLRRALDTERAFVADASHELRSPLAVLRGELELAARPGRSPAELTAAVRTSAEEADRLARITNDLLVLARGDAGRLELRLAETDLRDLLGRSAALAGPRLDAAGVTCRLDVPAGVRAHVDPDCVRQAVDNLLANAARFAPPGQSSCSRPGKTAPTCALRSATTDPASLTRSCRTPSSGSAGQTAAGAGTTAGPASASPSSRRSAPPTADGPRHATSPAAAPWSACSSPARSAEPDPAASQHGVRARGRLADTDPVAQRAGGVGGPALIPKARRLIRV